MAGRSLTHTDIALVLAFRNMPPTEKRAFLRLASVASQTNDEALLQKELSLFRTFQRPKKASAVEIPADQL
jgi:hypothetical protein